MSAEQKAREMYAAILRCWNQRDPAGAAALFCARGNTIGTPAAFHGRPEAVKALTEELQQELQRQKQS